jgi:hypothetical protein
MARAQEEPERNSMVSHVAIGSLLVWVGFILFTKVGSPQYLLWPAVLLPFLPLRGAGLWAVLALLAAGVFTTLVFPCQYKAVAGEGAHDGGTSPGPNLLGLVLLAGKSLSLAVAFLLLVAIVWRRVPAPPSEAH